MPSNIAPSETDAFTALRAVLLQILPTGVEVIRGQVNRVAPPKGPDYAVMVSSQRARLSTTVETWDQTDPNPTSMTAMAPAKVTIQVDFHGPASADNAWRAVTLVRSRWGCDAFAATNLHVGPLGTSDPRQAPFHDGEQQYEDRWVVDVELQINPTVTVPQDFADALTIGLIDVDAAYPPGG